MNNQKHYENGLNRRGYTVMLIFILLSIIIFWHLIFNTSEAATYIRFQKKAMNSSEISITK